MLGVGVEAGDMVGDGDEAGVAKETEASDGLRQGLEMGSGMGLGWAWLWMRSEVGDGTAFHLAMGLGLGGIWVWG